MNNYLEILDRIEASPTPVTPENAYLLFGYTREQFAEITARLDSDGSFEQARSLGFSIDTPRPNRNRETDYRSVGIHVPEHFQTRSDVVDGLRTILRHATPQGQSLLLLLTDHPDSALVSAIGNRHLVLIMSPTKAKIDQSPGSDWEEIDGGWKKDNILVSKKSLLLARQRGGRMRFSAAQAARRKEQIKDLCDGHWPNQDSDDLNEAQEVMAQIEFARQVLQEVHSYHRQAFPDLVRARRELENTEQRVDYGRQRLEKIQAEIEIYERQMRDLEETIATEAAKSRLDQRVRFAQAREDIEALGEVKELPAVKDVELDEPLINQMALKIETKIAGPRGPVSFAIRNHGVEFNYQPEGIDLQPRMLAIAEKFSRGQMADAVQIVCQSLLASDDYQIEND